MYSPNNPKIDLFKSDGSYFGSTNWFKTIKAAKAYFQAKGKDVQSGLFDRRSR